MDQQQHSWSKNHDVIPRLTTFTFDTIKQQNKFVQLFRSGFGPVQSGQFNSIPFKSDFMHYTSYEHNAFWIKHRIGRRFMVLTPLILKNDFRWPITLWWTFHSLAMIIVCVNVMIWKWKNFSTAFSFLNMLGYEYCTYSDPLNYISESNVLLCFLCVGFTIHRTYGDGLLLFRDPFTWQRQHGKQCSIWHGANVRVFIACICATVSECVRERGTPALISQIAGKKHRVIQFVFTFFRLY